MYVHVYDTIVFSINFEVVFNKCTNNLPIFYLKIHSVCLSGIYRKLKLNLNTACVHKCGTNTANRITSGFTCRNFDVLKSKKLT